ncbi:hypothetical protein [Methylobacter sp. BBA5.1]|jgi:hypothetical protein|uniref:hypothetical protein n=1 Tax=Methylobacter sp. BBA5.1 TaxID=1495064 RepID=UPI000A83BA6B|nr:hypothetical protein [Methylobacter sp. BBA5.1]
MAENTQNRLSRETALRRNFIQNCRNSRIHEKSNFSETVLRIYRRRFREVSRAAYLTRFYCSNGQGFDVEQQITKEMIAMIKDVNESIVKKIVVADQLIKKANIKVGEAQYESVNVTIIDPIAKLFLNTLNAARDLEEKLRALWLACQLDDTQKRQALAEIEKEFTDVHQRCRALMEGVKNRFYEQRRAREIARDALSGSTSEEIAVSETEIIEAIEKDTDVDESDSLPAPEKKSAKKSQSGSAGVSNLPVDALSADENLSDTTA